MGFTFFLKENLAIYGISPELSALIIAHLKWEIVVWVLLHF
jgi:hypothetical protein